MQTEGNYDAVMRLAEGARAGGDAVNALSIYRKAREMRPSAIEPIIGQAGAMVELGAYEEAVAAYQDALKLAPSHPAALRGLGSVFIALDQPELALAQYDSALLSAPDDPRALTGRGVALDLLGRHEEARTSYRSASEHAPQFVPARNNLGLSLIVGGYYDEAIAILTPIANSASRVRGNLALAHGIAGDMAQASRWLRADYDSESAARQLVYFGQLRTLSIPERAASLRNNPQYFPRPAPSRRPAP
ncbi:MAG: tetratricopeptide repeat protein [Alphaproteobacteria bacterium]|nr:tetratricopeptide repeat protein [Alphaproteobacteria bacterium]MCW5744167.1 tetratricopeptide repeat protein [Alphaproteobacteria bacterium]